MPVRCLAVLLLAAAAAPAAPFSPEQIDLIPGLHPRERRELKQKMGPLRGKSEGIEEALTAAGVDGVVARRIAQLAPGPLAVERYAHGLVLEAPGLTERQKEVFDHLHPAVLAAQWAVLMHKERALANLGLEPSDPLRARIAQSFDVQIREIEKRWWRMVSYLLTVDQRAAIHAWMPQPYQRPPQLEVHVYQVPGLTPSQASRVRALLTEMEAEVAADSAEIRRQQIRARDASLPAEERAEARRLEQEAGDRIGDLLVAAVERGREIFTPEQMKHLDALPPLLAAFERAQHFGEVVKQMGATPEQQAKLEALAKKAEERAAEARRKAQEATKEMRGELGSDSPQAMTMQMMEQGANAERLLALEEAAHEAFLEVVEKERILGWIISPR